MEGSLLYILKIQLNWSHIKQWCWASSLFINLSLWYGIWLSGYSSGLVEQLSVHITAKHSAPLTGRLRLPVSQKKYSAYFHLVCSILATMFDMFINIFAPTFWDWTDNFLIFSELLQRELGNSQTCSQEKQWVNKSNMLNLDARYGIGWNIVTVSNNVYEELASLCLNVSLR